MSKIKLEGSVDFINRLMKEGGPAMEMFIVHSVYAMSKLVLDNQEHIKAPASAPHFPKELWVKCALCLQEQFAIQTKLSRENKAKQNQQVVQP